jgi:hypothetical protein
MLEADMFDFSNKEIALYANSSPYLTPHHDFENDSDAYMHLLSDEINLCFSFRAELHPHQVIAVEIEPSFSNLTKNTIL